MLTINSDHNMAGFSMKFANGWTVSVQFGEYANCENRDFSHSKRNKNKSKCVNAEIAAWDASDEWYSFDYDNVKGWVSPDEVADFITMIKAKEN